MNVLGFCCVVGSSDCIFGIDWLEFCSVGYYGVIDDFRLGGLVMVEMVSQVIVLYLDLSMVCGVFYWFELLLVECVGLYDFYFDFIFGRLDVFIVRIGVVGWSYVYCLKLLVFIFVGVLGIELVELIVNVILQMISDCIQQLVEDWKVVVVVMSVVC